jgi:hypothetical protein
MRLDAAHREQKVSMQNLMDPLNEKMESTKAHLNKLDKLHGDLSTSSKQLA